MLRLIFLFSTLFVNTFAQGSTAAPVDNSCSDNGVLTNFAVICDDDAPTAICQQALGTTTPLAAGDPAASRPADCVSEKAIFYNSCPKSCGYCCLTPAYNCTNIHPSPIDCSPYTAKDCTANTALAKQLQQYCPQTCGMCDNGDCKDLTTCQEAWCFEPEMQGVVAEDCRKTCGLCGPNAVTVTNTPVVKPTSGTCTDDNPNCQDWAKNGFCSNPFYQSVWSECKLTCHLC